MAVEAKEKSSGRIACIEVFRRPSWVRKRTRSKRAVRRHRHGARLVRVVQRHRAGHAGLSLPYLFKSVEHQHNVMDGFIGEEIAKGFEEGPDRAGLLRWRRARHLQFEKAHRLDRRPQGDEVPRHAERCVFVDTMSALGANATPMPYGEVYSAIQTGVIDGAENNYQL